MRKSVLIYGAAAGVLIVVKHIEVAVPAGPFVFNQAKVDEMADKRRVMDSPIMGPLSVFLEPFPVRLLVTLISAGVLRKK